MTLTFAQGHRVTRNVKLVQSFCCKVAQTFAAVDDVTDIPAKKSCMVWRIWIV